MEKIYMANSGLLVKMSDCTSDWLKRRDGNRLHSATDKILTAAYNCYNSACAWFKNNHLIGHGGYDLFFVCLFWGIVINVKQIANQYLNYQWFSAKWTASKASQESSGRAECFTCIPFFFKAEKNRCHELIVL